MHWAACFEDVAPIFWSLSSILLLLTVNVILLLLDVCFGQLALRWVMAPLFALLAHKSFDKALL